MNTFKLTSIGFVKTVNESESISEIIINRELVDALVGIEDFSHCYVLFWMHNLKFAGSELKINPWGDESLPLLGVFATRTQYRPNPIGLTLVRLLSRVANVLRVKGLDAFDGTPILDLKPFDLWDVDEYFHVTVPNWWRIKRKEKWMRWQKLFENLG